MTTKVQTISLNLEPGQSQGVKVAGVRRVRIPLILWVTHERELDAVELGLPADVSEMTLLICHPSLTVKFDGRTYSHGQCIAWIEYLSEFTIEVMNTGVVPVPEPIVTGYNPTGARIVSA